jgi:pimeloyl-ACP methyl ester carboxylesterase
VLHAWLIFAAVLATSGVLLLAVILYFMALVLLRPERMTDAKANLVLRRLSPADLGLRYEEVPFDVRDERTGQPMRIAAWWIPAASAAPTTVLLIHGRGDAKVGAIAWAPTVHALGWNILAIDLRGHGESGGVHSTAGYWERHDVTQVIDQLRAARPRETETLVIFGVSLGAAVGVAATLLRHPLDIAGLILESPFADYRLAVAAHAKMQGYSGDALREIATRLAEWISGADFNAVRPQDLMPRLTCPVMVIHSGGDPFVPAEDATAMAESLKSRNHPNDILWSIPEAGHVLGMAEVGPEEYRKRVAKFLDRIAASPTVIQTVPVADSQPSAGGSGRG